MSGGRTFSRGRLADRYADGLMAGRGRQRGQRGGIGVGLVCGLLVLLMLVAAAMLVGAYPIVPGELVAAIGRRLAGERPGRIDTVLFEIRLPRIAAAVLVGAGLAAAGAAYQSLFRNPLVRISSASPPAPASAPCSASSCRCPCSASS